VPDPSSPEKPSRTLDVTAGGGKILGMMRLLFGSVIRASVLEAVSPSFADLREGQKRLDGRMDRLESKMDRIEERIDRLDARMDRLIGRFEATL
jgi:hypothetical protein